MVEKYFFGFNIENPFRSDILNIRSDLIEKGIVRQKKRYFPHVTIYPQGFNDEKTLIKIFKSLSFSEFELSFTKIYMKQFSKKILYLEVKITPQIQKIHNIFLDKFASLRNNALAQTILQEKSDMSDKNIALIEKYGYPYCRDQYRPHITLGTFNDLNKLKIATKAFSNIEIPEFLLIKEIILFKYNEKNDLWEELDKIKLSAPNEI